MARIRTIKPEFPQSESIGRLSRDARLLFIQLWTIVDDVGRARAASRLLASLLYPYDSDAPKLMDKWLAELEAAECIQCYQHDGASYLQIVNWSKHQKVDHPSASRLPEPPEVSREIREASRSLAPDLGPRTSTKDQDLGPVPAMGASNDSGFEAFWEAWVPYEMSKGGKQPALKAWTRHVVGSVPPETMLAQAAAYCALARRLNSKTKHVATWLNARGWEDDYGPPIDGAALVHDALREKWRREDEADGYGDDHEGIEVGHRGDRDRPAGTLLPAPAQRAN